MAKKKPGRPRSSQPPDKAVLNVELPAALKRAIDDLAHRNQRKITGEVILALQEHLKRNGVDPEGPPSLRPILPQ